MKTSLHVQSWKSWMPAMAEQLGSGWIKWVNPGTGADPAPKLSKLLRIWTDDWDGPPIRAGKAGAQTYMVRMMPQWAERHHWSNVVWELPNEPECNSEVGLRALNEFTLECIRIAEANNFTLCILNLPEGNPGGDPKGGQVDYDALRWKLSFLAPCVKATIGKHWIGQHAYWDPRVEGPTGENHSLRITKQLRIYRDLGIDTSNLRVFLNEAGIDGKIGGADDATGGWQKQSNAERYLLELAMFEFATQAIAQVAAYMLFDVGYQNPWASYDHNEAFMNRAAIVLKTPKFETLDLQWPLNDDIPITQRWGDNPGYYKPLGVDCHNGLDFSVPIGTAVFAAHDGIFRIGYSMVVSYGTYCWVEGSAYKTIYGHGSRLLVQDGVAVKKGQPIMVSGNTGRSTGPHLHFGLQIYGYTIPGYGLWCDPETYLHHRAIEPPISMLTKVMVPLRWNIEEGVRELETGKVEAAHTRMKGLIDGPESLAYRMERWVSEQEG